MFTAPAAQAGGGTNWMGFVEGLGGTLGPMLLARNDPRMAVAAQQALGLLSARREKAKEEAKAAEKKRALGAFLDRNSQAGWKNPGGENPNLPPPSPGVLSSAGIDRGHVDYLKLLDPALAQEILSERLFPEQDEVERNINAAARHGVDPKSAWMVEHGLTPTADKALGERGLMARHLMQSADNAATNAAANYRHDNQSANNAATVAASIYGTDAGIQNNIRTNQTSAENNRRTVGASIYGTDTAAASQAAQRAQVAEQFNRTLLDNQNARAMTDPMREFNFAMRNPEFTDFRKSTRGGSVESERELSRLQSIGIPRDVAIKIKEGVFQTVTDPVTREAVVVDLASGQPVYRVSMDGDQQSEPVAPPAQPALASARGAFGIEGAAKGLANTVSDAVGLGPQFPDVQEAQSDFAVLQEQLVNDIASGYDRQPPSWLLKNIRELTPQAGRPLQGASGAQSKLRALKRGLEGELRAVVPRGRGRMSPQAQQKSEARGVALRQAISRIDAALSRFGNQISADDAALINKYLPQ